MHMLVTGGAGFIGSSLCEELIKHRNKVSILDNFSAGNKNNIQHILRSNRTRLLTGDCTKIRDASKALEEADVVFHFAANPEVRLELSDAKTCFRQNIYATHTMLEAMRKSHAKKFVLPSTSTI